MNPIFFCCKTMTSLGKCFVLKSYFVLFSELHLRPGTEIIFSWKGKNQDLIKWLLYSQNTGFPASDTTVSQTCNFMFNRIDPSKEWLHCFVPFWAPKYVTDYSKDIQYKRESLPWRRWWILFFCWTKKKFGRCKYCATKFQKVINLMHHTPFWMISP